MKLFEVLLDNKSAWTGIHVYVAERHVAHVSIDPTFPGGPKLSLSAGWRSLSISVPHITWARASKGGIALRLYKRQQTILHNMDNRFGKI